LPPAEHIYEELALNDEIAQKTRHPKIFIGRLQPVDWEDICQAVESLQDLADSPEASTILRKLKEIVPEFEGSTLAAPASKTTIRSDAGHPVAGLNGNGKAAGMKKSG